VVSTALAAYLRGAPQELTVLAVFPQAVYATTPGGELLAVVTSDGVQHPNAAVILPPSADRPFARLRPGALGAVGDDGLRIGDLQVRTSRWWDPRPRLERRASGVVAATARTAAERVRATADPLPAPLHAAFAAVREALARDDHAGAATAAAERLIGAGPGLTPAGDDLLAGLLSGVATLGPAVVAPAGTLHRLGRATDAFGRVVVGAARDRTTALSAALLGHAARGELAAPAGGFLHALCGRGELDAATDRLLAVGSTSGRDLALGLLGAVELLERCARPLAVPAARKDR
jgi:hypothetical protein